MNPKQAEQLRRAIAKLLTARADCDYARAYEPQKVQVRQEHQAKCARRLERLLTLLTVKDE